MAGTDEGCIPEDQAASSSWVKRVPLRVLLRNTLALYFSRWKQHFLTALPPAILAVLVYAVAPVFLRAIWRGVRMGPVPIYGWPRFRPSRSSFLSSVCLGCWPHTPLQLCPARYSLVLPVANTPFMMPTHWPANVFAQFSL